MGGPADREPELRQGGPGAAPGPLLLLLLPTRRHRRRRWGPAPRRRRAPERGDFVDESTHAMAPMRRSVRAEGRCRTARFGVTAARFGHGAPPPAARRGVSCGGASSPGSPRGVQRGRPSGFSGARVCAGARDGRRVPGGPELRRRAARLAGHPRAAIAAHRPGFDRKPPRAARARARRGARTPATRPLATRTSASVPRVGAAGRRGAARGHPARRPGCRHLGRRSLDRRRRDAVALAGEPKWGVATRVGPYLRRKRGRAPPSAVAAPSGRVRPRSRSVSRGRRVADAARCARRSGRRRARAIESARNASKRKRELLRCGTGRHLFRTDVSHLEHGASLAEASTLGPHGASRPPSSRPPSPRRPSPQWPPPPPLLVRSPVPPPHHAASAATPRRRAAAAAADVCGALAAQTHDVRGGRSRCRPRGAAVRAAATPLTGRADRAATPPARVLSLTQAGEAGARRVSAACAEGSRCGKRRESDACPSSS